MLPPGPPGLMLLLSESQSFTDILIEKDETRRKNSAASQAYNSLRITTSCHRDASTFLGSKE